MAAAPSANSAAVAADTVALDLGDTAVEQRDLAATRASRATERTPAAVAAPEQPKAATKVAKPKTTTTKATKKTSAPVQSVPVQATGSMATVVAFALAQQGKPYRYAAAGPNAYDCSGLVAASYARIGVRLPHQSGGIGRMGRTVPRSQVRPGDVLYWPGHVAISLGGNRMVHASRYGVPVKVANVYGSPRVIRIVG